jgi:hypothetical protein
MALGDVPEAPGELLWETRFDGLAFALRRGGDGAHDFVYGDEARFRLSADFRALTCDVRDVTAPGWQRLLLDTVLWSTAYLSGLELLHASAVELDSRTMAFASTTGGGKTSLAIALLERGATLVCDDVLALSGGTPLIAHSGPGLMNVPREAVRAGPGTGLGERLASFPDEDWVELRERSCGSRELAAIFLLSRGAVETEVRRVPATVLDLMPHVVHLPSVLPRRRSQFMLISRLAGTVPVYQCQASVNVEPEALAELVIDAVAADRLVTGG